MNDKARIRNTTFAVPRIAAWCLGIIVLIAWLVLFVLPLFQTVRKWRPHQAWKNLKTINLALGNYHSEHKSFPYHPNGSDHALYVFSNTIDAHFFDSFPHEKPTPEAYWDHTKQRLVNGDFVYLNDPNLKSFWQPRVLLVERPHSKNQQWVLVGLFDGRITSCEISKEGYHDLLGNWETSDFFWIKDPEIYNRWEAIQFPDGSQGHSVSHGQLLSYAVAGPYRVDYVYAGDRLIERNWSGPAISVTEAIETDDIGRIIKLSRKPENWSSFWPYLAD